MEQGQHRHILMFKNVREQTGSYVPMSKVLLLLLFKDPELVSVIISSLNINRTYSFILVMMPANVGVAAVCILHVFIFIVCSSV